MDERTNYESMIDGAHQFASLIREYYKSLVESGFTKKEAFLLTVEYQKEILGMVKPK